MSKKPKSPEVKKYYSAYREGILTSDIVEQIEVYCVESKIPLPHWYEMDEEAVKDYLSIPGNKFKEL
jgi:hypothetical protein